MPGGLGTLGLVLVLRLYLRVASWRGALLLLAVGAAIGACFEVVTGAFHVELPEGTSAEKGLERVVRLVMTSFVVLVAVWQAVVGGLLAACTRRVALGAPSGPDTPRPMPASLALMPSAATPDDGAATGGGADGAPVEQREARWWRRLAVALAGNPYLGALGHLVMLGSLAKLLAKSFAG